MTPFGQKLRDLRAARNVTLKDMAAALRVTPAYLSALEHGRRGRPRSPSSRRPRATSHAQTSASRSSATMAAPLTAGSITADILHPP
jgi:transcriptional regulator with XRE-family HTH domain